MLIQRMVFFFMLCITCSSTFAQSTGSRYTLGIEQGVVTVPANQIWIIDGFEPYKSDIGTADLYFDGNVMIGKKYSLSGKFDFTISSGMAEPIVVYGGTKVTVGDSRGKVTIMAKPAQ